MFYSILSAFALYFSALLSIGIYFYHKNKNESDFSLANRSLNYWVTALSAQASDMSNWLFMGLPGMIYVQGLSGAWEAVGLALFMFLTWHFIAPKLRTETERFNSITLFSFYEQKFNDKSNFIRIISGILCLYFFTFYIAAGLVGIGKVFEFAFEIDYHSGILIGLCVTLAYTFLGGLLAIAWSDFFQGIFLLACIFFVPIYAAKNIGGITNLFSSLQIFGQDYVSLIPHGGVNTFIVTIFSILGWGIGYFGQPHILINFMGIDNPENIKKAKIVGSSWQIIALSSAILVGLVGKATLFPTLANQELVFIVMVKTLFSPFFAGLILCGILAATISTINTQALVSASLLSHDLYYPIINPQGTEKQKIQFTRFAIFILPLLSLLIAWNPDVNVFNLVLYGWSGLGSCFGPLTIISLYGKKLSTNGAIIGLILGGLTGIFWSQFNADIPILVAGYCINFGAYYLTTSFENK